MKAIVDANLCIGCCLCTEICPDVFTMSGDLAIVTKDPVPSDVEAACQDARDQCPVNAITTI
jgi:ferredoxin